MRLLGWVNSDGIYQVASAMSAFDFTSGNNCVFFVFLPLISILSTCCVIREKHYHDAAWNYQTATACEIAGQCLRMKL